MTRHGLFAILALTGILIIPDPTAARPSFRPAFTGGPFRIVLPTVRPHLSGAPRIHGPAMMPKPAQGAAKPVTHAASAGPAPFRRHHRFYGSAYPVTYGAGGDYYGTPYDPSDAPVYPVATTGDAPAPVLTTPAPEQVAQRGCRAQHVLVPNKYGAESEVTIIRC